MPQNKLTPYHFFVREFEYQPRGKKRFFKLTSYKNDGELDNSSIQSYMDCNVYPRLSKNNQELRFELARPGKQNTIGGGVSGQIIQSNATLTPNGIKTHHAKRNTTRVLKIFDYNSVTRESINSEWCGAQLMPHLHAKRPYGRWMVMERMPGDQLLRIMKANQITHAKLLCDLTQAIMLAYKKQIANLGLIHFDIKPENIVVDLSSPIVINFVDPGSVIREVDYRNGERRVFLGTPMYRAKEKSSIKSQKSDIYSLGKTLEQLWSFKGITHLCDEQTRLGFSKIIKSMVKSNPEERPAIDEILTLFNNVNPFASLDTLTTIEHLPMCSSSYTPV